MRALEYVTEIPQEKPGPLQRLAGVKPGPRRFEIAPAFLYPTMVNHIMAVLKRQERPQDSGLQRYYAMAKRLDGKFKDAFDLALRPRGDVDGPIQRERRAEALEICRLWFTRQLHIEIGEKTMVLRILKDDRYRL